jgi:polysaccharide deacetylase 2 family uncharacterized protein YibQ
MVSDTMSRVRRERRSRMGSISEWGVRQLLQMIMYDTEGACEYFLDALYAGRSRTEVTAQLDGIAELCRRRMDDGDRSVEEIRRRLCDCGYMV